MHDILTGQKIGRWTIGEEFKKNNKLYYKCICDCGNAKDVLRQTLLCGSSLSCGFYAKENTSRLQGTLNENEIIEKIQNILNP